MCPEYSTAWHIVILSHECLSYLLHVGCTFVCICKNSPGSINYSFQTHEFKSKLTTHQCSPDDKWTPVTINPSIWFPVLIVYWNALIIMHFVSPSLSHFSRRYFAIHIATEYLLRKAPISILLHMTFSHKHFIYQNHTIDNICICMLFSIVMPCWRWCTVIRFVCLPVQQVTNIPCLC
jgi:hypothetical protein